MFNKESIVNNSRKLYAVMKKTSQYSFDDLQGQSHLTDTDLCLAIGQLMQEGKLTQRKESGCIYYLIA